MITLIKPFTVSSMGRTVRAWTFGGALRIAAGFPLCVATITKRGRVVASRGLV